MLRSAAAPVSVVMLLALMVVSVFPSRVLRAAAATDVSVMVMLKLCPLSLIPANVAISPLEIVAVRLRLPCEINPERVLASATVIDPLAVKLQLLPKPEIVPAVSAA